MDKTDLVLIFKECDETAQPHIPADAINNSSIISSGTMNAKLSLWTAVLQFLLSKALFYVYTDLASPKSPSLQLIGFLPNTISSSSCL